MATLDKHILDTYKDAIECAERMCGTVGMDSEAFYSDFELVLEAAKRYVKEKEEQ